MTIKAELQEESPATHPAKTESYRQSQTKSNLEVIRSQTKDSNLYFYFCKPNPKYQSSVTKPTYN